MSEWEMLGRTGRERRGGEEKASAARSYVRSGREERESEAMRKETRGEAKCAWREEREAREGRRQRGGERRAAEQARRRDVRSGREEREWEMLG